MGTWSPDNFGNDDAADWAFSLAECTDLGRIETTVAGALVPSDKYLEAPAACEAIAAAEAVARLLGRWGVRDPYTEPMDAWVERMDVIPSAALVQRAQQALNRILAPQSELRELWEETEQAEQWTSHVMELRARLQTQPVTVFSMPVDVVRRIEHFGSTAVPGMAAKPVIDMLVEVSNLQAVKTRVVPVLEAQGYEYFWRPTHGEDGGPFYAWFIKRGPNGVRTHHIHMVEPASPSTGTGCCFGIIWPGMPMWHASTRP